jgi:hypothetical protein
LFRAVVFLPAGALQTVPWETAIEALMTENSGPGDGVRKQAAPTVNDRVRAGLALLWQAYLYAQDAGAALWDFALENAWLYRTALTISDLRWLVAKGLAEHGQETSFYGDPHRSFRKSVGLNFAATSCFVLTPKGAEFASRILKEPAAAGDATATHPSPVPLGGAAARDHPPVDPARPSSPTAGQVPSRRPRATKRNRHQINTSSTLEPWIGSRRINQNILRDRKTLPTSP